MDRWTTRESLIDLSIDRLTDATLTIVHFFPHKTTKQISGGHYNAAVTTVLSLLGKVPARVAVQYIVAQLFGAVGGGFLARGIATSLPDPSGAVTSEAGFIDALFSFGLVSTALQTAVSKARAGNSYFGAS